MKNYLNFENEIKNLENEIEKLKDPYNQEGLSEVDTQKISITQAELSLIHISEPTRLHTISYAVFCFKKFFF